MRVGVAGLGAGAVNALAANPGLSNHPRVKLTAAADLRKEARDAFAQQYGAKVYESVDAMCASGEIDVIYIITPNGLHAEHAVVAAEHKLQIIADKPMALSMAECDAMIEAAKRNGVRLLVGHTQSLDSGILAMAEVIRSGRIGKPTMVTSMYYSEWLYRPRGREELDPNSGDGGLTLRQGWIQFDMLRLLGGGMVRSVRGITVVADPKRPVDGAYAALLDFEDGTPATAIFDSYGYFDSSVLTFSLGLFGRKRTSAANLDAHKLVASFPNPADEFKFKDETRFGGPRARKGLDAPLDKHQFFGLTIVSCERGAIRQLPDGIMVHEAGAWHEIKSKFHLYAEVELDLMYEAWSKDKPLPRSDGAWGKATTEVCLGVMQSARERREIAMQHQVPSP